MKPLRIRETPWSKLPRFQVRQYVEGVISAVQGVEPYTLAEKIMKEVDSRFWGANASLQEVFNKALIDVLVILVGNDWDFYDRIVEQLRPPHDEDLASMKLLAIGDPKYRKAGRELMFRRRPWVSSMSIQKTMEDILAKQPWFEGIRVDQQDLNVFMINMNITGGIIKLILRFLRDMQGSSYIQIAIDSTQMNGEQAVFTGTRCRVEVLGLLSGDVFDLGQNAQTETTYIKTVLNQIMAENKEDFYFEAYETPDTFVRPEVYQAERTNKRATRETEALVAPDFTRVQEEGALKDCYDNLILFYPEIAEEASVEKADLEDWLKTYQRGMHDVKMTDMQRLLAQKNIGVVLQKKDIMPEYSQFMIQPDKTFIDKNREAAAKSILDPGLRRSVNKFADSFYVAMTKIQIAAGGTAHAFAGSSRTSPLFDLRPSSCWLLTSEARVRWHVGFECKGQMALNYALKRAVSWMRRNLEASVKVSRRKMTKTEKGYLGSVLVEVPLETFGKNVQPNLEEGLVFEPLTVV